MFVRLQTDMAAPAAAEIASIRELAIRRQHRPRIRRPGISGCDAGFDSHDALHAYFDHPAHLPVLEQWTNVAELAFADFEI